MPKLPEQMPTPEEMGEEESEEGAIEAPEAKDYEGLKASLKDAYEHISSGDPSYQDYGRKLERTIREEINGDDSDGAWEVRDMILRSGQSREKLTVENQQRGCLF